MGTCFHCGEPLDNNDELADALEGLADENHYVTRALQNASKILKRSGVEG